MQNSAFRPRLVVWFEIRDDKDLVQKFQQWMFAQGIAPFRQYVATPHTWEGAFTMDDAPRVESWLLTSGCPQE